VGDRHLLAARRQDQSRRASLAAVELTEQAGELNLAAHLSARELLGVLARHSGAGEPPVRRAAAFGRTLAASRDLPRRVATAHCETAQRLSRRLGLPGSVSGALHAVFERWDGRGFPDGRAGAQIPVPARFGNWLCTTPWNLAGLPAISVPAPASGLPAGVQIVAPAGGENVILSIAAGLERLRPWPQLAPLASAPGHP